MAAYLFPITVSIQEDGLYRAECPLLQGCWVDAATLEEALADIQEVIRLSIRSRIKHCEGWPKEQLAQAALPLSVSIPVEVP